MEENGAAGGQRKQRGHQLGLSRVRLDVPRGAAAQRKGPGSTRLVLWLVGLGTVGPAEAGSRARPGTEAGLPTGTAAALCTAVDTGPASGGSQLRLICAHVRPQTAEAGSPSLCQLTLPFASCLTFHSSIVFCKQSLS